MRIWFFRDPMSQPNESDNLSQVNASVDSCEEM